MGDSENNSGYTKEQMERFAPVIDSARAAVIHASSELANIDAEKGYAPSVLIAGLKVLGFLSGELMGSISRSTKPLQKWEVELFVHEINATLEKDANFKLVIEGEGKLDSHE